MSGSFLGDGFAGFGGPGRGGDGGSGSAGPGAGWPATGIWDAMEQLRNAFMPKQPTTRMGRGDVRAAVLSLLAERPMHGYQIISEIEERSGGTWKPSPGSVYPTLQLLADEGLIEAEESGGRKTYALTEAGRQVAAAEGATPWESSGSRDTGRHSALTKSGIDLAQAVAQVGRSGSSDQIREAVSVLDEARRKIFSILARD